MAAFPSLADALLANLNLPVVAGSRQAPAAAPIRRLFTLASANADLFQVTTGEEQSARNIRRSLQRADLDWKADANLAELILAAGIIAQRAHSITAEHHAAQAGVLAYGMQTDDWAMGAAKRLSSAFRRWATTDAQGMPSVAALERWVLDVDAYFYQTTCQAAGIRPADATSLLTMERALVDARLVKDVHAIWDALPEEAQDNLNRIGIGIPDPWMIYQPVPDAPVQARVLRLMSFADDVVNAASTYVEQHARLGKSQLPLPVWALSMELLGFRPPDALLKTFETRGAFIEPSILFSRIWMVRAATRPGGERLMAELEDRFGSDAVRWLRGGASDPASFANSLLLPGLGQSARAFARVSNLPTDYHLNLHVGDKAVFCGAGWAASQQLTVPTVIQLYTPARVSSKGGRPGLPWAPGGGGVPGLPGKPGGGPGGGGSGRPNGGGGGLPGFGEPIAKGGKKPAVKPKPTDGTVRIDLPKEPLSPIQSTNNVKLSPPTNAAPTSKSSANTATAPADTTLPKVRVKVTNATPSAITPSDAVSPSAATEPVKVRVKVTNTSPPPPSTMPLPVPEKPKPTAEQPASEPKVSVPRIGNADQQPATGNAKPQGLITPTEKPKCRADEVAMWLHTKGGWTCVPVTGGTGVVTPGGSQGPTILPPATFKPTDLSVQTGVQKSTEAPSTGFTTSGDCGCGA